MRTPAEIESAFHSADTMRLDQPFYLVGIGGAGMSALAFMLVRRGAKVRGSDSTHSATLDQLEAAGVAVDLGHDQARIHPSDQLVLSDAIVLDESPEVAEARRRGNRIYRRSQLLGRLLSGKRLIAVTGTHGKTTTTAMIGAGLQATEADPTVVVGAWVPEFGASVVEGNGEWAVAEACEAYDSFHDLQPEVVVLTNLELDHVDFHGSWERLRDSVARFVATLPWHGALVYAADDPGAAEIASRCGRQTIGYRAEDFPTEIALPGVHNRLNAAGAAAAIQWALGSSSGAVSAIASFRGAERRLQILRDDEIAVVDDYAHHPTEIAASISALRERFPGRRLVVAFQPHLYSRTAPLIAEFAQALDAADLVFVTDIYPAREEPMAGVSSARIEEAIAGPSRYVPSRHLLPRAVARAVVAGDVVVGMGAGTISEFAPALLDELGRTSLAQAVEGARLSIAVIVGGDSSEREVSLHSGRAIAEALRARGHRTEMFDLSDLLLRGASLARLAGPGRPDCAFLAVHGTHAEDGAIQGLLELLDLPYTGSGILASALAMDKQAAKEVLDRHGIAIPRGRLLHAGDPVPKWDPPLVVKPNAEGSTVGLTFVRDAAQLEPAIQRALAYGSGALLEEWVQGMEISVPVLGDRSLPPVEIVPASGAYDFASKYLPGATEEIVPARLPAEKLEEAQRLAERCHAALGCAGATRTDMIVRPNGEIVALEVNTLPGMTATSLLPNSARAAGMTMEDLCEWIVTDAMRRYASRT